MKKFFAIAIITACCACTRGHKSKKIVLLEAQAFYYYEHDKYALAKFYLDTLIVLDSRKGEYYFDRAYSREKLSNRKRFPCAYIFQQSLQSRSKYEQWIDAVDQDL
jgi:hypothetical protein